MREFCAPAPWIVNNPDYSYLVYAVNNASQRRYEQINVHAKMPPVVVEVPAEAAIPIAR